MTQSRNSQNTVLTPEIVKKTLKQVSKLTLQKKFAEISTLLQSKLRLDGNYESKKDLQFALAEMYKNRGYSYLDAARASQYGHSYLIKAQDQFSKAVHHGQIMHERAEVNSSFYLMVQGILCRALDGIEKCKKRMNASVSQPNTPPARKPIHNKSQSALSSPVNQRDMSEIFSSKIPAGRNDSSGSSSDQECKSESSNSPSPDPIQQGIACLKVGDYQQAKELIKDQVIYQHELLEILRFNLVRTLFGKSSEPADNSVQVIEYPTRYTFPV